MASLPPTPSIQQLLIKSQNSPQAALRCAQFFNSLSQYCLSYHKVAVQHISKTKPITKPRNKNKINAKAALASKSQFENPQNNGLNSLGGTGGSSATLNTSEPFKINTSQHPTLPRKPLTAYIIYFQEKKSDFETRHPGLILSELTRLIASEWKSLPQEVKNSYLLRAAQERKRYDREMLQYRATYGKEAEPDEDDDEVVSNAPQNNTVEQSAPITLPMPKVQSPSPIQLTVTPQIITKPQTQKTQKGKHSYKNHQSKGQSAAVKHTTSKNTTSVVKATQIRPAPTLEVLFKSVPVSVPVPVPVPVAAPTPTPIHVPQMLPVYFTVEGPQISPNSVPPVRNALPSQDMRTTYSNPNAGSMSGCELDLLINMNPERDSQEVVIVIQGHQSTPRNEVNNHSPTPQRKESDLGSLIIELQ